MKYLDVVFNLPLHSSFTYSMDNSVTCDLGFRVSVLFRNRKVTGYVIGSSEDRPVGNFEIKSIVKVIDSQAIFGKEEIELAEWISGMYFCSFGEALGIMLPGGRRVSVLPAFDAEDPVSSNVKKLSSEQKEAVETIVQSEERLLYLFGITGSGKTEVFLQAAEQIIAQGKGVIYLVPEISLTHQLARDLKTRFSCGIALLHSSLTPSQRLKEWMKIKNGDAPFVIGARSAVFAPVKNLGLIIIDEEHEGSYKSGSTPRYHARQVAMKRVLTADAKIVMGSATPSLEAYYLMENGRIKKMVLSRRLSGGKLPEHILVPMYSEPSPLSKTLLQAMRFTLEEKKQIILFLNRRGFSYFFHCRSCGYEMTCSHCSIPLTLHKDRNRMVCHYCGYSEKPITICPSCGSLDVGYSGFGTERIEEEVKRFFPEAAIRRVDSDTVRRKDVLKNILKDFYNGTIQILLGTQMVAKGLNFPGVNLVGIILADSSLHIPDFRAGERTFSLITQVSGRAGRFAEDGKVVIQTYDPENPAIKMAVENRQEDFYKKELEMRKILKFPPFFRLFRLVFRGKVRVDVEKIASRVSLTLKSAERKKTEILGPSECPVSKISGNFRVQIIIRTLEFSTVHNDINNLYNVMPKSSVYMEIDVDPVSLM